MTHSAVRSFLSVSFLAALLCGMTAGPALAQQKPINPDEWSKNVYGKWNSQAARQVDDLAKGAMPPTKDDEAVIELAAKYYAYFLNSREAEKESAIHRHFAGFESLIGLAQTNRPGSDKFLDLFLTGVLLHARTVLYADRIDLLHESLAQVNATRMIARIAAAGREDAVAVLAEVLEKKDDKGQYRFNDGVLFCAVRGVGESFSLAFQPTPITLKDQKLQQRCILALLDLLPARLPLSGTLQPDQELGLQYFRREVIRALAFSRYPAVVDDKNPKRGLTALALAQIVDLNNKEPLRVRWDERLEAAIGLTRMQPALAKTYRPDYAARKIAQFVVEFVSGEFQAIGDTEGGKLRKEDMNLQAIRLADALKQLSQQLEKDDKDLKAAWKDDELKAMRAYVKDVSDKCNDVLLNLKSANTAALEGFLGNSPAPSQQIYQGMAESSLEPAAKPPAGTGPDKKPPQE